MKFGQLLSNLAIPEWRLCYLDYRLLKRLIDLIVQANHIKQKRKSLLSVSDLHLINQIMTQANKYFFRLHNDEVMLIFAFVQYKIIFLTDRKLEYMSFHGSVDVGNEVFLASIENDLMAINLEGQRKILKKHKKSMQKAQLPCPEKFSVFIERLQPQLDELKDSAQQIYIQKSPLQSKQSRSNIRQLLEVDHSSTTTAFVFGSGVGVIGSIIVVIIVLLAYEGIRIDSDPYFVRDFPVHRGNILIIISMWMFALNIFTFEKFHINYKLIFKFNTSETSAHVFSRVSIVSISCIVFLLAWVIQRVTRLNFSMIYFGGIAWLITLCYFFIPVPLFNWRGRFDMLKLIGRTLISPIMGIDFPVCWVADHITSLVTSFQDAAYAICYYSALNLRQDPTSAINYCSSSTNVYVIFLVGMFCFLLRMLQCIRQGITAGRYWCAPYFLNTIKYGLGLLTLILSFVYSAANQRVFAAWCVFSVISTLWSYAWDLKMDWGLLQKGSKNKFLRDDLAYGSPIIYYVIIVVNLILRLIWILTLSPNILNRFHVKPIVFTLITGALEILRRAIWTVLNVQQQHIANCQALEAIKHDQNIDQLKATIQNQSLTTLQIAAPNPTQKQALQQRSAKLRQNLYVLIQKKKDKAEFLQKYLYQKQKQLKAIDKKTQIPG